MQRTPTDSRSYNKRPKAAAEEEEVDGGRVGVVHERS
jgi:hypothetical protein